MAYAATLPSIVNKMKLNARLIALIAPSRIHEGWIPDEPSSPSIYITPIAGSLVQTLSSANQPHHTLQGQLKWQIDALSSSSMEEADSLARIACEACLPSIKVAGIFNLNMYPRSVTFDKGYNAFRSTWRLGSNFVEHVTG